MKVLIDMNLSPRWLDLLGHSFDQKSFLAISH
jgi:predicted nuclease of predicted toxin-antitoxin system